jgi:type II secretory pathway component PulM
MSDQPSETSSKEPVKAAEIPAAPPPPEKKGSAFSRFLRHIFSPETRTGRFMRPLVRGLGLVVGLFALGLLSGYVLLYQPLERSYRAAATQLERDRQIQADQEEKLRKAADSLVGNESQRKQAQTDLAKVQTHLSLAQVQTQILTARLALAQNDSVAVKTAFSQVETGLKAVQPQLTDLGVTKLDSLNTVLSLAKGDLDRDPHLVDQDLQRLASEVQLIDQSLR